MPALLIEQPLKTATPATAALVSPFVPVSAQVSVTPAGDPVIDNVTLSVEPVPLVTTASLAFSRLTTGWVNSASPTAPLPGSVVKARWLAPLTVKVVLVAKVIEPFVTSVAVSVKKVPAVLIEQLVKAAVPVPELALSGFEVQAYMTPCPRPVMDSLIESVKPVTTLPPASSMLTAG